LRGCRSPQLAMLEGMLEIRLGEVPRARAAFARGAKHARGGATGELYSPLFQAWAQLEEASGDAARGAELHAECDKVQAAERASTRPARPRQEGWQSDAALVGLVDIESLDPGDLPSPQPGGDDGAFDAAADGNAAAGYVSNDGDGEAGDASAQGGAAQRGAPRGVALDETASAAP
jgi:hypothetical protein